MNMLADNWTAIGSIATGFGAVAAFLAIVVTVLVYRYQSRRDKAAAIQENLQFLHSQQTQVVQSIESGFLAVIDRQIREFRARLGSTADPGYFLDHLFGDGQSSGDRCLFQASALDSNLSSTMYARMSDIWDRINMTAFEFRGALGIFACACRALTSEARRLCAPETTAGILDIMAKQKVRDSLSKIECLDKLVNRLLSGQLELAKCEFEDELKRLRMGCSFITTLADKALQLSDRNLLKLARKKVKQPDLNELDKRPNDIIRTSLDHIRPMLSVKDYCELREVLDSWQPWSADAQPARPYPPETSASRSSGAESGVTGL
jgi:type II secretory pathway pseudopilin PulG